ncbi:hypothetical protein BB734_13660 [Mycobacterium avium subsp. hominissuis]|uniref:Uncharacterized protein n=4 Tax=Mycobacterium avium complex (MAC) TaxID=120793 RepID=A0A2A3LFS2_MYCAV|nr:Hypothetical protein MIP_04223 [Mycobacterium intracellulare subsp. intracellulare MTCC 9506]APT10417.1 hypothetical protein BS641_09215 [Mycobacterium avium subsp. hominissuis]ARV82701.1 hypothetical protein BWK49_16420 [Mycobacterium intracellulare subsp. chimaera]ASW95873.1 hypothetical protein CKJ67_14580 [Mycobacterium intracellulare]ELR85548.1 hypothetical protein W7U_09990 [Mycobacterium sp. H4Y]ETZ39200.1 hypothetical protein L842_5891 [Mycobacterium intracellulare MIN_052511_1280]
MRPVWFLVEPMSFTPVVGGIASDTWQVVVARQPRRRRRRRVGNDGDEQDGGATNSSRMMCKFNGKGTSFRPRSNNRLASKP